MRTTLVVFQQMSIAALLILCAFWSAELHAQNRVGTVQTLRGLVTARDAAGDTRTLAKGDAIFPNDLITTGGAAHAYLVFQNGSSVFVRPYSELQIDERRATQSLPPANAVRSGPGTTLLSMLKGAFRVVSTSIRGSNGGAFSYRTPVATIGIRGTEFEVQVAPSTESSVYVVDGEVEVENPSVPGVSERVRAGEFTVIRPLQAPTAAKPFRSEDIDSGRSESIKTDRVDDPLLESSESPAEARYVAFADPDLDMQTNPAYATQGRGNSGTFALLGSSESQSNRQRQGPSLSSEDRSSDGLIGQAVGLWQVGSQSWLGSFGSLSTLTERQRINEEGISGQELSTERDRAAVLVARARGHYALGLSLIHDRSTIKEQERDDGESIRFNTENSASQLVLGGLANHQDGRNLGLSLSATELRGDTKGEDSITRLRGQQYALETLLRSSPESSPRWGVRLRIEQSDTDEAVNDPEEGILDEATDAWSIRSAAGLGWTPSPQSLVSLDFALGYAREDATQREPDRTFLEKEIEERLSAALHLGVQVRLGSILVASLGSSFQYLQDDVHVESPAEADEVESVQRYFSTWTAGLGAHKNGWYAGYFAGSQNGPDEGLSHNFFVVRQW